MKDFGVEGPPGALGPSGWGEREGLQGVLGPDFSWADVSEAIKDGTALATLVVDYLGLGSKERRIAREIIGEGEQEAERAAVFLMAAGMKRERKWRWITLGVACAGLVLSIVSLVVSLRGG